MFNLFALIIISISYLFSGKSALAFKADTFVNIVNTVDNFQGTGKNQITPLDTPQLIYNESTSSGIFNTWMLTPNAYKSSTISAFFKKISKDDPRQEIGLFLKFEDGSSLQSLKPAERELAVDKTMEEFFAVFGFYPKSLSASSFDAYTLQYLQAKYSVLGAVVIPNSSEDLPSNNGAYSYSPYFPSKKNLLIPAKTLKSKINLAFSETTPLQNFSLTENLPFYTQKTLNEFTLLNLSTSNNILLDKNDLRVFFKSVSELRGKYDLQFSTYSIFSDWFKARYPESTPAFIFKKTNTNLVTEYLYQSPWYKFTFSDTSSSTNFKSLFVYNQNLFEANISTPSLDRSEITPLQNILENNKDLTTNKNGGPLVTNYLKQWDSWSISFQNQYEKITLDPDKIIFQNLLPPQIKSPALKVTVKNNLVTWTPVFHTPFQNSSIVNLLFWLVLLILLLFFFFKNQTPPTLALVLLVIVSMTTFRSGSLLPFGMGFWGPTGHDSIFHLSIIQKFLSNPFSLSHPQISAEYLSNYHFIFAYLSAIIVKVTGTTPLLFYFKIFPIFSGLVLIKLISIFMDRLKLTSLQKKISFLFIFLGSSLGFIIRFAQGQGFGGGESAFWVNQSASMFLNPPYILSLIFLLLFLNAYAKEGRSNMDFLMMIFFGALLAQTKVYAFILLCLALLFKKEFKILFWVSLCGLIISVPFIGSGSAPFVFQPLWFTRAMFASPDRFYLPRIADAWQAYEANGLFFKLIILNLLGLAVFLLGNLGSRVVGLYTLFNQKSSSRLNSLIKVIIIFSLVIPLIFVQKSNPWNTIQFTYYGLFFLSFYTAKTFTKKSLVLVLICLLGTFGSIGTLRDYFTKNSTARISYLELASLEYLSSLPKGIVLSPLYTEKTSFSAPQPLYDYVSSSYISAISSQPEFVSDTINLEITDIKFHSRANEVNKFYNTLDTVWARGFLVDGNISYVMETPNMRVKFNPTEVNLQKIFSSSEINIYHIIN